MPSEEEQHVIALQAKLNEVKDNNLKLSKQLIKAQSLLQQEIMPVSQASALKPKMSRTTEIDDARKKCSMEHGGPQIRQTQDHEKG